MLVNGRSPHAAIRRVACSLNMRLNTDPCFGDDLPLFAPRPDEPERSKIERAFWKFHDENPAVYAALVRLAFQWHHARGNKVGIATLYECVRWETNLTAVGKDGYKMSNSHRAFYARLIMTENPTLSGMFTLKRQKQQASFGQDQTIFP